MYFFRLPLVLIFFASLPIFANPAFELHFVELSLSGWNSEVQKSVADPVEEGETSSFYSIPKVSAYGKTFGVSYIAELPLQYQTLEEGSSVTLGDASLFLGYGYADFYLYGGLSYPLYEPETDFRKPFVGTGNLSLNSLLGYSSPQGLLPMNSQLKVGYLFKYYFEDLLGAQGELSSGDNSSFAFLNLSAPVAKQVKLYMESLFFMESFTWQRRYIEETKIAQSLGGGLEWNLGKIGLNLGVGTILWSDHKIIPILTGEGLEKEESAFFYHLKIGFYF